MLNDLIASRRDDLTSVDRRLAATVLGDPAAAAFMSVRELALAAGVHESGVVRLAHMSISMSGSGKFRRPPMRWPVRGMYSSGRMATPVSWRS